MMRIFVLSCFAVLFSLSGLAQKKGMPKLTFLWETEAVLNDLESVIYDAKRKVFYVTNINGHWLKPNGKGFISKLALNGEIIERKWIENIDGPTGTAMYNDKLFVADFNVILEIDLNEEKIKKVHNIKGATRINDLCVSKEGIVFGSGTKSGKLFAIEKDKVSVVKENLDWPNGLLYEENKVIIGLGDKTVKSYDLKSKKLTTITSNISNPDGIVALDNGSYLISSWEGMIHYVTANGDKKVLLDTRKEKINAADITYIPSLQMVLVPAMLQHKLMAYKLEL